MKYVKIKQQRDHAERLARLKHTIFGKYESRNQNTDK